MARLIACLIFFLCNSYLNFAQHPTTKNYLLKTDTSYIPLGKNSTKYKHLKTTYDSTRINRMRAAKADSAKRSLVLVSGATQPGRVPLDIKISCTKSTVYDIADLSVYITITNKTYRTQRFLFDRPIPASGGIWAEQCVITNAQNHAVTRIVASEIPKQSPRDLERHYYKLGPGEWIMKGYPVSTLAVFDQSQLKKGKLPPGRYTLQLFIHNNPSNSVSFTIR